MFIQEALAMFALKMGKKGGKLGECEAALKRRTDRPFMTIKTIKSWR